MIFLHFPFTAMQYLLLLFMSSLSLVVKVFVFYHLFQARESHRSGCDSFIHSFWRGTVLSWCSGPKQINWPTHCFAQDRKWEERNGKNIRENTQTDSRWVNSLLVLSLICLCRIASHQTHCARREHIYCRDCGKIAEKEQRMRERDNLCNLSSHLNHWHRHH